MYTPLFIDTSGWQVLVIGGGAVGARKAAELAAGGAAVTLLSPRCDEAVWRRVPHTWRQETFDPARPESLGGFRLVIAATDDKELNRQIARLAREQNLLCNAASAASAGNVILPGVVKSGGITLAITSGGQTPFLTSRLKAEIAPLLAAYDEATIERLGTVRRVIITRWAADAAMKKRLLHKLANISTAEFNALWDAKKGNCDEIIDRLQREQAGADPD